MNTDPEIVAVARDGECVELRLRIPSEWCWFEGHFPEVPLLPGVIQTKLAVDYGRRYFSITANFLKLSNVKFTRFIQPGAELRLRLTYNAAKAEVSFEYAEGEAVCSAGRIGFAL